MGSIVELTVPPTLSVYSIAQLRSAVDDACGDAAVAGLVLQGEADVFCRGLDLIAVADPAVQPSVLTAALVDLLAAIRFAPRPTVAWVRGAAAGGGVGLAAACDLVLADQGSSFSLPELLFGFFPAIIQPVLAERLSPQRLRMRALEAGTWSATTAYADGLVDAIVHSDEAPGVIAQRLRAMSRLRSETVHAWKARTTPTSVAGFRAALEEGGRATAAALADPIIRQRIIAFDQEGIAPWLQTS